MAEIDKALNDLRSSIDKLDDDDNITKDEMKSIISVAVSDSIEASEKKPNVSTYRTTTEKPKPVTIVDISDNVLNKLSAVLPAYAQAADTLIVQEQEDAESMFGKIFRWVKDGMMGILSWIGELIGWALNMITDAVKKVGRFIMMKLLASIAASSAGRLAGGRGRGGRVLKLLAGAGLLTAAGGLTAAALDDDMFDKTMSVFAPGWADVETALNDVNQKAGQALSDPEKFIESMRRKIILDI